MPVLLCRTDWLYRNWVIIKSSCRKKEYDLNRIKCKLIKQRNMFNFYSIINSYPIDIWVECRTDSLPVVGICATYVIYTFYSEIFKFADFNRRLKLRHTLNAYCLNGFIKLLYLVLKITKHNLDRKLLKEVNFCHAVISEELKTDDGSCLYWQNRIDHICDFDDEVNSNTCEVPYNLTWGPKTFQLH